MFDAHGKKWVKVVFIILLVLMLVFSVLPFLGSM